MPAPVTASPAVVVGQRQVIWLLVGILAALNIGNVVSIALGADTRATRYLLMALEQNPSTWFTAMVLAFAGVLALAVGNGRPDVGQWRIVAAVLGWLSLDEVAMVHERLGGLPLPAVGTRAWAGAGLVLVALTAGRLLPWALRLDPALRFALVAGGGLFVGGAVGLEVISGSRFVSNGSDYPYWALATLEENLEILGPLVVVRALLHDLTVRTSPLLVAFRH